MPSFTNLILIEKKTFKSTCKSTGCIAAWYIVKLFFADFYTVVVFLWDFASSRNLN